jgi:hypothetical protein
MNARARALVELLWVAHWPSAANGWTAADPQPLTATGPLLDTCLRRLAFGLVPRPAALPALLDGGELLVGRDAYRLLLEVATGLRSAVAGETNVFGQLREAIARFQRDGDAGEVRRLRPLLDQLLRDTREIRQQALEGIGGHSYGSLVRRLLAARSDDRVLFIGAGELTRSMLPLFRQPETALWNRSPVKRPVAAGRLFAPDEAATAANWATLAVMTTPPDSGHDQHWLPLLGSTRVRQLVHLGHRSAATLPAPAGLQLATLAEVFALAAAQAEHRERQLGSARLACAAHAGLLIETAGHRPAALRASA